MNWDIFFEIHDGLPRQGPGRNRYTRKAFRMLPKLDKPCILDIGCGSGEPTLELARLSHGRVIGIDTHQPFLDKLSEKIKREGLSHRVQALNCSMFDMDFPKESFDIIWAEGSIYIIGFERGLKEWRRLLKPGGFLAVHEMVWLCPDPPKEIADYWKNIYSGICLAKDKVAQVIACSYSLIGHYVLPEDAWWIEYYHPLEQRIEEMRTKYADDHSALSVLDEEQREIDMYKKHARWYGSAFFVMKKNDN